MERREGSHTLPVCPSLGKHTDNPLRKFRVSLKTFSAEMLTLKSYESPVIC